MKKLFLITLITLLVVPAVAGCGVPAEDYDKVVSDLDAAQAQIQKLESENASLQSDLETAIAENDALTEEITSTLDEAYAYEQVLVELLLPAITGDELTEPFKISNVQEFVDKTDDETLKEKFDAWSKSPSNRTLAGELLDYALLTLEDILYH